MRILLIALWLLVPLGVVAYHYHGSGEQKLKNDEAQDHIKLGYEALKKEEYQNAIDHFNKGLKELGSKEKKTSRRIRLEIAKAKMEVAQLPIAREEMQTLIEELQNDKKVDKELLRGAKAAYASTRFYMAYLMRLEELPRELWEPEIEGGRQGYKELYQEAKEEGLDDEAEVYAKDVEACVRLARAELDDLQGRAIPVPWRGWKSGKGRGRGSKKPGKKGKKSKQPSDARAAGMGDPPDDGGS